MIGGRDTGGVAPSGRRRRRRAAASAAGALLAGLLSGCASAGGATAGSSAPTTDDRYGVLPSFLPTSAITPDSVLTGTVQRPALTSQGDGVQVRLADSSVLATAAGPAVPVVGLPYRAPTATCTFTITLAGERGHVMIDVADFAAVDHLGRVYRLVAVPGHGPRSTTLGVGRTTTFEIRTVMPTGEGLLQWAPDGERVVASWDFTVETD